MEHPLADSEDPDSAQIAHKTSDHDSLRADLDFTLYGWLDLPCVLNKHFTQRHKMNAFSKPRHGSTR